VEIAQEQRRVANRQQTATAVADDENEEHHGMDRVLSFAVGFEQRTDQQHRRAGGADEARQKAADAHERGVGHRVGSQVAFDANAAADGVEAEQQHDERNVFLHHRVAENRLDVTDLHRAVGVGGNMVDGPVAFDWRGVEERIVGKCRGTERGGHFETVCIGFPPMRRAADQGQHGDRAQQQHKRCDGVERRRAVGMLGRMPRFSGNIVGGGTVRRGNDHFRAPLR
jgi:hypothetical protein